MGGSLNHFVDGKLKVWDLKYRRYEWSTYSIAGILRFSGRVILETISPKRAVVL